MFVIYIMPVVTNIAQKHSSINNPLLTKAIRGDLDEYLTKQDTGVTDDGDVKNKSKRRTSFLTALAIGSIAVVYGVSVLVLQLM